MKSQEAFVNSESNYYIYSPTATTERTFFYLIANGRFIYEPGYQLQRDSYDSFLLMYIQKGSMQITFEDKKMTASSEQFALLDCYEAHAYQTEKGCECVWMHFDGPVAREYYTLIHEHLGSVFSIQDSFAAIHTMNQIYQDCVAGKRIPSALLSKQISDLLTCFLLEESSKTNSTTETTELDDVIRYIHAHFAEPLTVEELARHAMLSQYHFIRVFKKWYGCTPHDYIRRLRISNAKYLLKTTNASIKGISFRIGFSSESAFCSAFKKQEGVTPASYRNHN